MTVTNFITAAILAASLSSPTLASENYFTGNTLKEYCNAPANQNYGQGMCLGFTMGIWFGTTEKTCVPEGVTSGQLAAVVTKYMNDHPELLHEQARDIVFTALFEAFPCKEGDQ